MGGEIEDEGESWALFIWRHSRAKHGNQKGGDDIEDCKGSGTGAFASLYKAGRGAKLRFRQMRRPANHGHCPATIFVTPNLMSAADTARPADDTDPQETQEWLASLDALIAAEGPQRAVFLLDQLATFARGKGVGWKPELCTPYQNTIAVNEQPAFPGDLAIEERLGSIMRWNALAMVARANAAYGELGGHIASYASAADLFEVGFNHFFPHAMTRDRGDLVFFQPHSAPGVYARAFLEGRLTADDLNYYRRELGGRAAGARGLSSYPHPYLMPDFWQFPTGSMGIGPINLDLSGALHALPDAPPPA